MRTCIFVSSNTTSLHMQAKAVLTRRLESDRLLHGALTEEKERQWEEMKKGYEKLLASMQVRRLSYVRSSFPYVCAGVRISVRVLIGE